MGAREIGKWHDRDCEIAVVKVQKSTSSCARKAIDARVAAMAKDGCAFTNVVNRVFTAKIPLPPGGAGGVGNPVSATLAWSPAHSFAPVPAFRLGAETACNSPIVIADPETDMCMVATAICHGGQARHH